LPEKAAGSLRVSTRVLQKPKTLIFSFQFGLGYDRNEQAFTRTVHATGPDGSETNSVAGRDPVMACPDREQLELLLTKRLADTARDELETHVEDCSDCQQVLEQAVWTGIATARGMDSAPPATSLLLAVTESS
jgi:hypothetical protein